MRRLASYAVVFATLAASGCVDSADENVDVGVLVERYDGTPMIDVPATVRPGQPFAVSIMTIAAGCSGFSSTDARMTAAGALVTPYDRYGGPDEPCTRELGEIRHEVTLLFDVPGTRYVRFVARRNMTYIEVERQVTVAY
jgi:hypothetical protein